MDEAKLFHTLTKVDVVLKWMLKGGLALMVFSTLAVAFVCMILKLLF